jgi:RNA polymerase sigma-70 factor (sigma-E family)
MLEATLLGRRRVYEAVTMSDAAAAIPAVPVVFQAYVGDFDAFVIEQGASLARTAYLLTADHQLAEDLVQTALAKVAVRWGRIAEQGHPGPYVRKTMVRTAIGWHRRKWRGELPTERMPDGATVDETAAVDARDRLRRALLALPARQRAAVVLRFYEDRTEADVAVLMGCSVGTVKSQTSKGIARLRLTLESDSRRATS